MKLTLGNKIKLLRVREHLTQKQLAAQMGVTPQAASKWENDWAYPDILSLPNLSRILHISLDDLFSDDEASLVGDMRLEKISG